MQSPRIISSSAFNIIGMAMNTKPGSPEIGQLWKKYFATNNKAIDRAEPGVCYGVMQLDRSSGVLRYMAGESCLSNLNIPPDLTLWEVPASSYAIFQANLENVSSIFTEVYSQWLPNSGFTRATGPDLERYGTEFPENPNFEIWIPIRSL